ncbi:hypothetical protein [Alkaliphilus transvaalensis]|uniref:hypothetical protein n=1 Tax=Alkaliphilus transvaalensis TaxID=114628 RepID=UPI0012EC7B0C|nr:hypothetical protein [Alkaliphilus transvaalensis]
MTKTISIRNFRLELNISKLKKDACVLLRNKKEIERELRHQLVQREREAQVRNFIWLS